MMTDIADLISKCKNGDRRAQYFLFERAKKKWMGVCVRYVGSGPEAEDVFQEAVIRILGNIGQLQDATVFDAWSKRIIINQAINYLKARNSYSIAVSSYHETTTDIEQGEEQAIARLDAGELLEIINTMPEGYRIIFSLYMIDGYKHKEIADALGITEASSRSQLKKARRSLMEKLEKLNTGKNAKIV